MRGTTEGFNNGGRARGGEKEGMRRGSVRCVHEVTVRWVRGKGKTARGSGGVGERLVRCAASAVVALLPSVDVGSGRFGFPRCLHMVSVLCLLTLSVSSCRRIVGDHTRGKADGETTGSRRT